MLKIIHLASDEKFIDRGVNFFREDKRTFNSMLVVSDVPSNNYITSKPDYRFSSKQEAEICEVTNNYDAIVLHSLQRPFYKAIEESKNKFVIWIGMGFDYYDLIYPTKYHLMMEETKRFYISEISNLSEETIHDQIRNTKVSSEKLKIIRKIDAISTVLPCEHEMISSENISLPRYLSWNYIYEDLEDIFSNRSFSKKRSVIIGNSSDPSNNHLDVLKILEGVNINPDEKIIAPLSYGNRKYAEKVEEIFDKKYGGKFIPLKEYMSIQDYTNILEGANTCIMGHKRQQGMGNIIMMLRLGYKVYMNEESPAYSFLKKNGIKLFSLKDIERMKDEITKPLEHHYIIENIRIIKDLFNANKNRQRTKKIIDEMINKKLTHAKMN